MRDALVRLPWFVAGPVVLALAAAAAYVSHVYAGPLFHEECRNERNLLTGEIEPSNCGQGARVRSGADQEPAPRPTATDEPPASPTQPPSRPSPTTGSPDPDSTPIPEAPAPGVLAVGEFRNGAPGHFGSGDVEVQRLADGTVNVFLKGFSVTNGPDLFVVLGRDPGGDYADGDLVLGRLTANNGSLNYAVPEGTDISGWGSVIIWCRQFDVVFAYAPLGGAP